MGLDMYLSAKRFVWRNLNDDGAISNIIAEHYPELSSLSNGDKLDNLGSVSYIIVRAAYWRKANAIHGWFVQNIQDGSDDCGHYPVYRESLKELRDLCAEVLENKDGEVASENLPPAKGFFFGSYSIDEYYWEDLKNTVSMIDKCLALPDQWDFEYHSSW